MNNENKKPAQAVVSVKLDSTVQEQLKKEAQDQGITLSELMRNKLQESKAEVTEQTAVTEPTASTAEKNVVVNLSDESLMAVANYLTKVIPFKQPLQTMVVAPEREHLRKLAGMEPESDVTLSIAEEKYLTDWKEAITADVTGKLLTKHMSVPFLSLDSNPLQAKAIKEMVEKREEFATEKVPTLTAVFQKAIAKAFFEDARSLYGKSLFKATYGMDYSEFEAIFEL